MRKSIAAAVNALLVSSALVGCGSAPPAPPEAPSAANAPAVENAAPAPSAAPAEAPAPEDESAPTDGAKKAPAGAMSEEKMRNAKSLEEAFPKIENVTKELGAPFAKGKGVRRGWRYDKKPGTKSFSCQTIDLVKGPSGRVTFDLSVLSGDECSKVTNTKAHVQSVLAGLGAQASDHVDAMAEKVNKPFDEAAAAFEKKLGKASEAGEPDFAAWKYADENGECRVVLVTSHLGSKAGQAIWGLPCE